GVKVFDLLRRPELGIETLKHVLPSDYDHEIYELLEIHVKYDGYIKKAQREADKILRFESRHIPIDLDYHRIHNISAEAKEKFSTINTIILRKAIRLLCC